jgi:hypothetical protein
MGRFHGTLFPVPHNVPRQFRSVRITDPPKDIEETSLRMATAIINRFTLNLPPRRLLCLARKPLCRGAIDCPGDSGDPIPLKSSSSSFSISFFGVGPHPQSRTKHDDDDDEDDCDNSGCPECLIQPIEDPKIAQSGPFRFAMKIRAITFGK